MNKLGKKARMKTQRNRRVDVNDVEEGMRRFRDGIDLEKAMS